MLKRFSTFVFICLLVAGPSLGFADTRYVSDELVITVRTGPGNQYQILETLKTDSPVEILEETENHFKARTRKGTEGYVLKQYITKNTPKKLLIARLEKEKAALERRLEQAKEERQQQVQVASSEQAKVAALTSDLKNTRDELAQVSSAFEELKERSEGVLELTAERDQLLEENTRINSELAILQEENKDFHRSNMIQWFLAGGGVFFFGWLIGKISRKKKRGFSRL